MQYFLHWDKSFENLIIKKQKNNIKIWNRALFNERKVKNKHIRNGIKPKTLVLFMRK